MGLKKFIKGEFKLLYVSPERLENKYFLDNIEKAKVRGNKIKLIGKVYKKDNLVKGYVTPIEIDENHPLYCVDYKNKGIYYKTDTLGDISIIGGASGTMNAAASILRDIILLRGV